MQFARKCCFTSCRSARRGLLRGGCSRHGPAGTAAHLLAVDASCLPPLASGLQTSARRTLATDCRGPGSVPPHNCQLFICGPRPDSSDGSDQRFSQLGNEALQEAVEVHIEREQEPTSIAWIFSLGMCECPPECEPGDILLFPHYLHLRPTAAASELHSSSLSGMSGALLDEIATLEPQQHGDERQPGEAPQWVAADFGETAYTGDKSEQEGLDNTALVEVIGSVRHRSYVFIWSHMQTDCSGGQVGYGPGSLQQDLSSEMSMNASLKPSDVTVLQCSPPLTGTHPPDGSATTGPLMPGVGVAVFTAQSRAYATWGAGIGEWFEDYGGAGNGTLAEGSKVLPSSPLPSLLTSFIVSTHDSGAGPYTMNALAHVIASGAAWRGRLGLGQDEAQAVYNHFTATTASAPR